MPDPTLLTRGKTEGQAVGGAGGVFDTDIQCGGDSTLTVQVDLTGAANGDLLVTVTPFEADNATLIGIVMTPVQSAGPTFAGGRVTFFAQYDVTAFDKVRVRVTNNNAGAQTITRMSWRLA